MTKRSSEPAQQAAPSAVPAEVIRLVDQFDLHRDEYRTAGGGGYNETQVRREFIDPLFKALGWDIDNTAGYAEAYKDVIHEDAIKVGGATKAPDYCFRIGGTRKFFVEAKKPSVDIKGDPSPAYQLRRYAWSAKLPLSILTDFEELAVYDCRIQPKRTDRSSVGRILYVRYDELPTRWDELASTFSREAVLKGSVDRYAQSARKNRGTAEFDEVFLEEIESWREHLARNMALRNKQLDRYALNFAVQRTIDRIIFLRMCEDRGIERYGALQALLNGAKVFDRLNILFRAADARYNSGLFHFAPDKGRTEAHDELTPSLTIDDGVLKDILKRLYYPESPYEFSVIAPEILGQVYEQFLGKVITLTAGHRARIEDKPEVRKAGGVYYTPTYIVDYIVKQTVGRLLEELKPVTARGAKKLRILDPACGSGSFLIGAYQYLLDWHLRWYAANDPEHWVKQKKPPIVQVARAGGPARDRENAAVGSDFRLTTAERKRILLSNIYGVDIDSQAVEVTKLSLLLKVLEGESQDSIERQMRFFHQRALPDLGHNIKCGNSLIAPDFYDKRQMSLLDEEEQRRINVFDWHKEFAPIMKAGGFTAVIGNPPYIFTRELITAPERRYFSTHFRASWEKHNTFMLFMEEMIRLLVLEGFGGFIVPNSWLTIESAKLLRDLYRDRICSLVDLNYSVFHRVSMEPCIFIAAGASLATPAQVTRVKTPDEFKSAQFHPVDRAHWRQRGGRFVFSSYVDGSVSVVIDGLVSRSGTVGEVFDVRTGLQAYEKGRGDPRQTAADVRDHVFDRAHEADEHTYPYLQGRDVLRYRVSWSGSWLRYGPWLSQPRELSLFTRPRVLLREITSQLPQCLRAVLIDKTFLNNKSILNVLDKSDNRTRLFTLLGALNSGLMSLFYKDRAVKSSRRLFPKVVIKNLREFPFPKNANSELCDRMVDLVQLMLDLQKKQAAAKTPYEKDRLQRQVETTDRQIDELVYQLYRLTEDEIHIVDQAIRKASERSRL